MLVFLQKNYCFVLERRYVMAIPKYDELMKPLLVAIQDDRSDTDFAEYEVIYLITAF